MKNFIQCCCALAVGAGIAATPARAQSVTNLYPGTTSIYLPYVNQPDNGQIGTPPAVGVSLGGSRTPVPFVMDTGSVGLVVSTDIYNPTGPNLGPGSITYTSSGKIEEGHYYNASVNFFNGNHVVATADVPILVVDAIACTPNPRNCTPTDHPTGVSQMGIGFGQEAAGQPDGTPAANPFLNIVSTAIPGGALPSRGYVVTPNGVQIGLTAANTQGYAMVKLSNYTPYSTPGVPEWLLAPASVSVNGNAGSGAILSDTGVSYMYLTPALGTQVSTISLPIECNEQCAPPGTVVVVTMPGQSTPVASYTFTVGTTTGNGNVQPGNALSPWSVTVDGDAATTFVNTTVNFLNGYNYIYDATNGFVGYQYTGAVSSAYGGATPSFALQGNVDLPSGFATTLPIYLMDVSQVYAPGSDIGFLDRSGLGITISALDTATFAGPIAGSSPLTFGGGTIILSAQNTYTGATTIDPGAVLALAGAGSIAASSGVTANGVFDISRTAGGASITTLSGTGGVSLGGQALTVTNAAGVFGGVIADGGLGGGTGGSLVIAGGTETLTGVNTYTGPTIIGQGAVLALAGTGSIAASSGVAANGVFDISQTTAGAAIMTLAGSGGISLGAQALTLTNASGSFAGVIADGGLGGGGGGGGLVIGGGTETLTGVNTYTGPTAIASGATLALAGQGSVAASSGVTANGVLDISQTAAGASIATLSGAGGVSLGGQALTLTNATGTFAGVIADGGLGGGGGGELVIAGGTATLTGVNTYTGGTAITGGAALAIKADTALGAVAGPLIFDNGTLLTSGGYATARAIGVTGGGGTIDAGGAVSLAGPLSIDGPFAVLGALTIDGAPIRNDGTLTATSLMVAAGAMLRGTGIVAAPTTVAGTLAPGNSPGTLTFTAPVTLRPGATTRLDIDGTGTGTGAGNYSRIVVTGTGNGFAADGKLQPQLRGITGSAGNAYTPPLGQQFVVVDAQGGVQGRFASLVQPAGLIAGSRFDVLYGADTVTLVVRPVSYGALAHTGLPQTANQAAVGAALDALAPPDGVAMTAAQATVLTPLYQLPADAIPVALESLAPTIDADAVMVWRDAWYLVSGAIGGAMETRRGGQPDSQEQTAEGPRGSTIWLTGLGQFASVGSAGGVPGYSGSTGGVVAGVDMPVLPWLTAGGALAFTSPQVSTKNGQTFSGQALQVTAYASAHQGVFFADAQLGGLFFQDTTHRPLPAYGAQANGQTSGTGVGGSVRVGAHLPVDAWQVEPSVGLTGLGLSRGGFTETQGGAANLTLASQGLTSIQSVLAARVERRFAVGETMALVPTARIGWAHEFADTTGTATATFASDPGTPFSVDSPPIGRDAALIGLGATLQTGGPVSLYLAYNGAFAQNANTQTLTGGVSVKW